MKHRFLPATSLLLCGLRVASATLLYSTRFENVTWDNDNWQLMTTNLDQGHYQSRMSLANGYMGINLAAVGPFFEVDTPVDGDNINGWPLFDRRQAFATIGGFYDSQPTTNGTNFEWLNQYGGESVISGVPHWAGLLLQAGDSVLDASVDAAQISDFRTVLDMKAATLNYSYTWSPSADASIGVHYSVFVHKLYVNQAAVQLQLTASSDMAVTIIDVLDGDCAARTQFAGSGYEKGSSMIYSSVKPNGIENVTAYVYSTLKGDPTCHPSSGQRVTDANIIGHNSSSIAQSVQVSLRAGLPSIVSKYIGGASTDAFDDPQTVARKASSKGAKTGFTAMLASHMEEWASILTEDSIDSFTYPENGTLPEDPNIVELQITSVTNPFNLLQNTVGLNAITASGNNPNLNTNSISVCGLGSDCYAGFIFWDAEVWMAPGIAVSHPQAAQQIANYRVKLFDQAKANIETAYQSSQNMTSFDSSGAVFPWTSGRFGNCTGTGPCFDYEYHINGDIGLEIYNYYVVTGDLDYWETYLFPIYDAVAQLYVDLLKFNETTGKYTLSNATDPDEYANHVDNPGFTMVLMKTHIETAIEFCEQFGMDVPSEWKTKSANTLIPIDQDANVILEYTTMNGTISVKQADVVLVDDFLDYPNPYSLSDLDYYASKQSLSGPGMTYGVFSIVANEISPSGCSSYTYDLYGSQPYTRGPWFQYSEQLLDDYTANGGTHPAYPFLTGMGGAHRVAVFGYLGLRLMVDTLNVNPSLPPQIPYLDFRTIYWQGHPINVTSNQTHTVLRRNLPSSYILPNANSAFVDSAIPVTVGLTGDVIHPLSPNGAVVFENRQIGNINTVAGNLAQCRPVTSPQDYEPGQFPIAAVDGAASTKWQPVAANVTSALTVELPLGYQPISGFYFDWAQNPPESYTVSFSNSTADIYNFNPGGVNITSSDNVQISNPYNASAVALIQPYTSNTTNVTLDSPTWSGKYATLYISGNQGFPGMDNATGASVAEWAILATDGSALEVRHYRPRRNAPLW